MKKICLFSLLLIVSIHLARAVECSSQHNTYQQLNATILVRTAEDAKRVTPVLLINTRAELNTILEHDIRDILTREPDISADELRQQVQCIQGIGRAEEENRSLPYVIRMNGARNQMIIAYVINAGGEGIPDSLPFMALWSYASHGWSVHHADLKFYLRSSFSLTLLPSNDHNDDYLLASGKEYGDSASRLKLTLFEIKKDQIDQLWNVFNFNAGTFDVHDNQIRIRYFPSTDNETYKTVTYVVSVKGVEQLAK